MCLIVEKGSQIRCADRDVVCWKVLCFDYGDGLVSPYMREMYVLGEEKVLKGEGLKKEWRSEMIDSHYEVARGFHTYANYSDASVYAASENMFGTKKYVVVPCVIPVGANYIEGKVNGEECGYVSDRLIVGKEIV